MVKKMVPFCGVKSWLIGCFLFPCICMCPIDEREVDDGVVDPAQMMQMQMMQQNQQMMQQNQNQNHPTIVQVVPATVPGSVNQ